MDEQKNVKTVTIKCSNEECGKNSIYSEEEITEELGSIKCKECGNVQYISNFRNFFR